MKTMQNKIENPAMCFAHWKVYTILYLILGMNILNNSRKRLTRDKVIESWDIVALKEMYLKILIHAKIRQVAAMFQNCVSQNAR